MDGSCLYFSMACDFRRYLFFIFITGGHFIGFLTVDEILLFEYIYLKPALRLRPISNATVHTSE